MSLLFQKAGEINQNSRPAEDMDPVQEGSFMTT